MIRRAQKATQPSYPKDPEELKDIEIPDWIKQTHKGKDFMLHDSGVEDPDRFFMFATDSGIQLLEDNHILRINECIPRTNNFVESWHNAFSVILN